MSFAIYGESDSYVHLVSAPYESEAIALLLEDISSVDVQLKNVFNVYATEGRHECKRLEDYVEKLIESAKNG